MARSCAVVCHLPPRVSSAQVPDQRQRHRVHRVRFDDWAYTRGVRCHFIRPGKQIENAYVESSDGKLRDERLNENCFITMEDTRTRIEGVEDRLQPGPTAVRAGQPHASRVCSTSQLGCSRCGLELGVRSEWHGVGWLYDGYSMRCSGAYHRRWQS